MTWKRNLWIPGLGIILMTTALASATGAEPGLKSVTARTLKLSVPEAWKEVKTDSEFRAAQFDIPGQGEGEGAELVVYHFGGPTGGIRANIERWIGQFEEKDRTVSLTRGTSTAGDFIVADISGVWKKPDGPPFARKTIATPGSRVTNVILITGSGDAKDYYFFKLAGPDAVVKREARALRNSFSADTSTEKPFELADAEN